MANALLKNEKMFLVQRKRFHGEDYDDPNSFSQYNIHEHNKNLAIAISVGGKPDCHPFTDLNEDSVGIAVESERFLTAVADAHNGNIAAKLVVDTVINNAEALMNCLETTRKHDFFREQFVKYIYPQSEKLAENNRKHDYSYRSRTQLSVVLTDQKHIYWANFGDSRIYTSWKINGTFALAPVIHHRFIGHPMTQEQFRENLRTGILSWPNSDKDNFIIVCSDGFPEATYPEVPPYRIIEWIKDANTAANGCSKLMENAFTLGACDNLSCAVLKQ